MRKNIVFCLLILSSLSSCILPRKYNALVSKETKFESTLAGLNTKIKSLEDNLAIEKDARIKLEQDTIKWAQEYKKLNYKYLNNISGETSETTRFIRQIDDAQREIRYLRKQIDEKERNIKFKEIASDNFTDLVNTFIMSFPSEGIKMSADDQKVTLTIDDALLFEPGGYFLTIESADLMSYIASFLARNPNISATVLSNTDPSDSLQGGDKNFENEDSIASLNFKPWELSVKRSTEIVRQILKNAGVNKKNIIAAGRGDADIISIGTDELSKSKNRRTQIILTKN